MYRVAIKDLGQYEKAIEVLTRIGGTYQGVGSRDWYLLVSEGQYKALVEAKVVARGNGLKETDRGKSSKAQGAQLRGNA